MAKIKSRHLDRSSANGQPRPAILGPWKVTV